MQRIFASCDNVKKCATKRQSSGPRDATNAKLQCNIFLFLWHSRKFSAPRESPKKSTIFVVHKVWKVFIFTQIPELPINLLDPFQ